MINFCKRVIRKILTLLIKPKKVIFLDQPFISELKKDFKHSERVFYYGKKLYSADSLFCYAVPGTLEQGILILKKLFADKKSKRLLNLGGGTGQISSIFEKMGFDAYTLDIEKGAVDNHYVQFDLNTPEPLPLKTDFFDVVFCQEVIEHIENPWKLFRDVFPVLKKGGYFIVTTPNIASEKSKSVFKKKGYFHWFEARDLSYHINPVPFWELKMIAQKTGYNNVSTVGSSDYYFSEQGSPITMKKIIKNNESLISLFRK